MKVNDYAMEASHPPNLSKRCPEGSMPVERTKRNGHFGDSPLSHRYRNPRYFHQRAGTRDILKDNINVHEHSAIAVRGDKYYGAKAHINVWNPKVERETEFSLAQIWVVTEDRLTSLEAGWMVSPYMYHDYETRFFTFWTDDKTGNWWLYLQGNAMGYWPKELLPSFSQGAGMVEFGGEIVNWGAEGEHTHTQMGSGHFSEESFKRSSFFKNVQVVDASYAYTDPQDPTEIIKKDKCYDLHAGRVKDGPWGYYFYFGGPGGSAKKCT